MQDGSTSVGSALSHVEGRGTGHQLCVCSSGFCSYADLLGGWMCVSHCPKLPGRWAVQNGRKLQCLFVFTFKATNLFILFSPCVDSSSLSLLICCLSVKHVLSTCYVPEIQWWERQLWSLLYYYVFSICICLCPGFSCFSPPGGLHAGAGILRYNSLTLVFPLPAACGSGSVAWHLVTWVYASLLWPILSSLLPFFVSSLAFLGTENIRKGAIDLPSPDSLIKWSLQLWLCCAEVRIRGFCPGLPCRSRAQALRLSSAAFPGSYSKELDMKWNSQGQIGAYMGCWHRWQWPYLLHHNTGLWILCYILSLRWDNILILRVGSV